MEVVMSFEYSREEQLFVDHIYSRYATGEAANLSPHQCYVAALETYAAMMGPRTGEIGACRPNPDSLAWAMLQCAIRRELGGVSEELVGAFVTELYAYLYAAYSANVKHSANLIQRRGDSHYLGEFELPAWLMEGFCERYYD